MAYVPASRENHPHHYETRITTDHDEIRRWVETRGGRPARVRGNLDPDEVALLRLDFGDPGEPLASISWDEFFRKFDAGDLALLYREQEKQHEPSRFHQLVHRGNLHT